MTKTLTGYAYRYRIEIDELPNGYEPRGYTVYCDAMFAGNVVRIDRVGWFQTYDAASADAMLRLR